MHVVWIIALTGEEVLYGYGPLGVFAVAAVIALRAMTSYFMADRDRVIKQRDQLITDMTEKTLPLLTRTADLLERRQSIDEEMIKEFRAAQKLAASAEEVLKDVRRMLELRR